MSTANAVAREVEWLSSFGDGLPALSVPNGPWGNIQGYLPRIAPKKKSGIYVTRPGFKVMRFANVRSMATYEFRLSLVWPLSSGIGSAESDIQQFDAAIELLLQRIYGPVGDKTHGGRFLSVAEAPKFIEVALDDPDATVPSGAGFTAAVMYSADDNEFIN
jgi:hypothetical protein